METEQVDSEVRRVQLEQDIKRKEVEIAEAINQQQDIIQKNEKLSHSISQLSEKHQELNSQNEKLLLQKTEIDENIKKLTEETNTLKKEITTLEENLVKSRKDLEKYQKFFDSNDCVEKKHKLEHYETVLRLYHYGVHEIFNESVPIEYLYQLNEPFKEKKQHLNHQIISIENALTDLKGSYIQVISEIEKGANEL